MTVVISCFVALLAQTTFLHRIQWHNGVVSMVVIALVFATRACSQRNALLLGAFCGFVEDALCGSGFAWTISTAAVAFAVNRLAKVVEIERYVFVVAVIAIATFVRDLLFWSVTLITGAPLAFLAHDLHMSLWNTALTTIAALMVVRPLQGLSGWVSR